ncbi:hypothetical protein ABT143_01660 [Streptomyces sp. NPDC002033]
MSAAHATGMFGNSCRTVPARPLRTLAAAVPASFGANENGWD